MKNGVRHIAIASGPISKRRTILIGIIFRNDYVEGMLSSTVERDGIDSTNQIIKMVKRSRFKDQIRILVFNGIALAGLNIIDVEKLERELDSKVVLLNRRKQNAKELINALKELSRLKKVDVDSRIALVESSKKFNSIKAEGFFLQSSLEVHYMKKFAQYAFESLRIAHIIARGVSSGESKGRL